MYKTKKIKFKSVLPGANYLDKYLSSWLRYVLSVNCVQEKLCVNTNLYFHGVASRFHSRSCIHSVPKKTISRHFAPNHASNNIS